MTQEYDHDQAVRDMIAREKEASAIPYFKCSNCGKKFFGTAPKSCPKCEENK